MKICVFSGSAEPCSDDVRDAMAKFGNWCAQKSHTVICGGMAFGGMKLIGDSVLSAGGELYCVTPIEFESYEAAHSLPHPKMLRENTENLHQRLERMVTMAEAFVAFPGGLGTIHEVMQVWADNQAATYHKEGTRKPKPLLLYTGDFFGYLLSQMDHCSMLGYIKAEHINLATPVNSWERLMEELERITQ